MRTPHILTRSKRLELPLRMIWVDTEALNQEGKPEAGEQRLWFGVSIYERYAHREAESPVEQSRLHFTEASTFWEWVESHAHKGTRLWVMAHNWNYDAGILNTSNLLPERGWEMSKYINGKPPLIVSWRKDGATIYMVDTLNYFGVSLATLGQSLVTRKLEMPSDTHDKEAWDAYAWQDVTVIHHAILALRDFWRTHGLGVFQPTLASLAFEAFRHSFMHSEIAIHSNEDVLLMEREAYHGGMTEAKWYGPVECALYKLDINSMYPSIMINTPLPVRYMGKFPKAQPLWWKAVSRTHSRLARCWIDTDEPCYGVVRDHRLIFPIGRFQATLTSCEIEYAERQGHLKMVGEWCYYEREVIFDTFMEYFYRIRQAYGAEGNEAFRFMCKIFMNSLYGKFGQRGMRWEETAEYSTDSTTPIYYQETPESPILKIRNRLGVTQVFSDEGEAQNSLPIIAAEITGYARMLLWSYMAQAGVENVYYVDTDSLLVNQQGYERLMGRLSSDVLGSLKVEWKGTSAVIWAPKDYRLGDTAFIKGVRKTSQEVEPNTFEQDAFQSWDVNLQDASDGFIKVTRVRKRLTRVNSKVIVDGVGFTRPIELKEW